MHYPDDIPPNAVDLIRNLLKPNPKERFTFEQIKAHPYFAGCSFDEKVVIEQPPPFVPNRSDELDTSYFDGITLSTLTILSVPDLILSPARKMYWSSVRMDSGNHNSSDPNAPPKTDAFNSFWFINGPNLKMINDELKK